MKRHYDTIYREVMEYRVCKECENDLMDTRKTISKSI
jgi:hypothetical protein